MWILLGEMGDEEAKKKKKMVVRGGVSSSSSSSALKILLCYKTGSTVPETNPVCNRSHAGKD